MVLLYQTLHVTASVTTIGHCPEQVVSWRPDAYIPSTCMLTQGLGLNIKCWVSVLESFRLVKGRYGKEDGAGSLDIREIHKQTAIIAVVCR
jgi:hypothetical protein